jgi:hypothetical protein
MTESIEIQVPERDAAPFETTEPGYVPRTFCVPAGDTEQIAGRGQGVVSGRRRNAFHSTAYDFGSAPNRSRLQKADVLLNRPCAWRFEPFVRDDRDRVLRVTRLVEVRFARWSTAWLCAAVWEGCHRKGSLASSQPFTRASRRWSVGYREP